MPELPEVEVIRQGLQRHLPGRKVLDIKTGNRKLRLPLPRRNLKKYILNSQVGSVDRRAKYLLIGMASGATLVIHLGMSGRLGLFPKNAPRLKHDHFWLELDNGLQLRFNDARRFGSIQVLVPGETLESKIPGMGPEPLGPEFTAAYLHEKSRGRKQPVKNFLMDGRVVVGIGNIYACETLFKAAVKPTTSAEKLGIKRWQRVADAAQKVLQQAIDSGGTSISDFVNASGKSGYFQLELQTYAREGRPCKRCSTAIVKKSMAGRSTFFCPKCQR